MRVGLKNGCISLGVKSFSTVKIYLIVKQQYVLLEFNTKTLQTF